MSSTVLPKKNEGKSRLTRASSSVSTPVVATMTEDGKDTIPRLQQCLTWTLPNSGGVVKAKGDVLVLLHSKRFLRRRGGHFAESLWSGVRAKKRGDNLETEGVEISGVVRTALARAWVNLEFFDDRGRDIVRSSYSAAAAVGSGGGDGAIVNGDGCDGDGLHPPVCEISIDGCWDGRRQKKNIQLFLRCG